MRATLVAAVPIAARHSGGCGEPRNRGPLGLPWPLDNRAHQQALDDAVFPWYSGHGDR